MRVGELHIGVRGREHRFPDPRIVRIGRDPASDVVLEDATVSRLHATFEPSSYGWIFRYAGSTHGSYLEDGEQTVSAPFFATRSAVLDPVGVVSSAQWTMAASASTTDLNDIRSVDLAVTGAGRSALLDRELPANSRCAVASAAAGRERWDHTGGVWLRDMGAALLLTVGALTLAVIVLQRRDPVRSAEREKV